MMLVQSEAYREQYGFKSTFFLPVNLYGPSDNFDLKTSHVIPAIIRKCIDAIKNGDTSRTLWGTGNVTREFIFVSDAAEGIVLSTEKYDESNPVNIGSEIEITINELANNGEIIWVHSIPDGQPRRKLDTQLAESKFRFVALNLCGLKSFRYPHLAFFN